MSILTSKANTEANQDTNVGGAATALRGTAYTQAIGVSKVTSIIDLYKEGSLYQMGEQIGDYSTIGGNRQSPDGMGKEYGYAYASKTYGNESKYLPHSQFEVFTGKDRLGGEVFSEKPDPVKYYG